MPDRPGNLGVMHVLFDGNACSIFDSRRIVESGAREMAISSYSGRNIAPMFTCNVFFLRFTASISNYHKSRKSELQFTCQVQQAYTLRLMRNYCRTWLQSSLRSFPGESFKLPYSFPSDPTDPSVRLFLFPLYRDEFIKVLRSDTEDTNRVRSPAETQMFRL